MPDKVLLIVNCPHDVSYRNRFLLRELYASRFDHMAFALSRTCPADPTFDNLIQSWDAPHLSNECLCGSTNLGRHSTFRHLTHPRLADAAERAREFDYVVFVEDDCILSPAVNKDSVPARWSQFDVVMPPLAPCPRDHTSWVWTQHATGYPAFDEVSAHLDFKTAFRNWQRYHDLADCEEQGPMMFFGFVDCLVFKSETLCQLAELFLLLREVWHEAAIPTAVIHQTGKIGVLDGVALWGEHRERQLHQLLRMLRGRDFVHPIKPGQHDPRLLLQAYGDLQSDSNSCS